MNRADEVVDAAVSVLESGGIAILATDTVYGLVAAADSEAAIERLYELKRRPADIPLALLAADLATLSQALGPITARERAAMWATLPGPYTLIVNEPGERYVRLRGHDRPGLGVRVPRLPERAQRVVARVGPVASTSANLHGEPEAASVAQLAPELRSAVDIVVDDGTLPGVASTVVDLTGPQPIVLRAGAVPAAAALAAIAGASDA